VNIFRLDSTGSGYGPVATVVNTIMNGEILTLMMEAISSSETLVNIYQTTRRQNTVIFTVMKILVP
jgi:hypothetical protein